MIVLWICLGLFFLFIFGIILSGRAFFQVSSENIKKSFFLQYNFFYYIISLRYENGIVKFYFLGYQIYSQNLKEENNKKTNREENTFVIEAKEKSEESSDFVEYKKNVLDGDVLDIEGQASEEKNFNHENKWDDIFEDIDGKIDFEEKKEHLSEKLHDLLQKIKVYYSKYLTVKETIKEKYKKHKFALTLLLKNLRKILYKFHIKGKIDYGTSDMEKMGKFLAAYYGTKVLNKNFEFFPKFYDSDFYFNGEMKFFVSHMRILWTLCIIFIIMIKEWKLIRGLLKK